MIDGPGPPITLRLTGAPRGLEPIIRCALICRSEPGTVDSCDAQRILLLYFFDGGESSRLEPRPAAVPPSRAADRRSSSRVSSRGSRRGADRDQAWETDERKQCCEAAQNARAGAQAMHRSASNVALTCSRRYAISSSRLTSSSVWRVNVA